MVRSDARESQREIARMSDELTIRLQVLQESGARPRTRVEAARISAGGRSVNDWVGGIDFANADIEAIAFLVLMQASKSAQEDLRAIMEEVKSINEAKARQRELLARIQAESAAAAAKAGRRYDESIEVVGNPWGVDDREGKDDHEEDDEDDERQEKPGEGKRAPSDGGDLDALIAVLLGVYAIDIEREAQQAKDDLDSMSEMGEMESLRLQMAMDRMSKMMSTLSNLLKKISDTSAQITQNLK